MEENYFLIAKFIKRDDKNDIRIPIARKVSESKINILVWFNIENAYNYMQSKNIFDLYHTIIIGNTTYIDKNKELLNNVYNPKREMIFSYEYMDNKGEKAYRETFYVLMQCKGAEPELPFIKEEKDNNSCYVLGFHNIESAKKYFEFMCEKFDLSKNSYKIEKKDLAFFFNIKNYFYKYSRNLYLIFDLFDPSS